MRPRPSPGRVRLARVAFYGGVTLLLVGALVPFWDQPPPSGVASRIGRNSEAYVLALLLAGWVEAVRPRLSGRRSEWPVTLVAAAAAAGIGSALLVSGLPARWVTLNEAFLALVVLLPWVQPRRPAGRRLTLPLVGLVAAVILLGGERVPVVTDQAESLGALLLVPITLDLVDRAVLDQTAAGSRPVRWSWYAALVLVPVLLSVLQYDVGVAGWASDPVRFGVRIAESFIACLLLSGYFAVALGWTGARAGRSPGSSVRSAAG